MKQGGRRVADRHDRAVDPRAPVVDGSGRPCRAQPLCRTGDTAELVTGPPGGPLQRSDRMPKRAEVLDVGGREVRVSNPEKVYFPQPGLT